MSPTSPGLWNEQTVGHKYFTPLRNERPCPSQSETSSPQMCRQIPPRTPISHPRKVRKEDAFCLMGSLWQGIPYTTGLEFYLETVFSRQTSISQRIHLGKKPAPRWSDSRSGQRGEVKTPGPPAATDPAKRIHTETYLSVSAQAHINFLN